MTDKDAGLSSRSDELTERQVTILLNYVAGMLESSDMGWFEPLRNLVLRAVRSERGTPSPEAVEAARRYLENGFLGVDKSELLCNEIVRLSERSDSEGGRK